MSKLAKALTAAAGNAGGESLYVEDVFSTYLYEGTGSSIAINNGIDLAGEGGLVIYRRRDGAENWSYQDTERGVDSVIYSDSTNAAANPGGYGLASFNSDGFTTELNTSGADYASWTFRKAEKFFDIVTYTGDGTSNRDISHNLNSDVGFIVIKRLNSSGGWIARHNSFGVDENIELNNTGSSFTASLQYIKSTTSTTFTIGVNGDVNSSGSTYVAYLFASDAGGFGDDGSESIIKCGSFTTDGSATPQDINLGFEPQFFMYKRTDAASNWFMVDTMRGWTAQNTSGESAETYLYANLSVAEASPNPWGSSPNATGINWRATGLTSNSTYIYIAIRRPMKTPESGTEVFAPISLGTTTEPGFVSGFVTDFSIHRTVNETGSRQVSSRMTGNKYMFSDATNAEGSISAIQWDFMDGSRVGNGTANANEIQWMLKRATGCFDVVAYSGSGSAHNEAHNLGVVPEMMIVKARSGARAWRVYTDVVGNTGSLRLNADAAADSGVTAYWNNTTPTNSVFTVGTDNDTNSASYTYIAYLFATLAGVSKVGSYTGTGSNVDVDCGFSAGARFILIKRTDSSGDWYLWDSLRGIVAGNDPYLLLNSTAAEVTNTDYIDPLNAGFTVTSSAPAALNASGGSYIFLAIS